MKKKKITKNNQIKYRYTTLIDSACVNCLIWFSNSEEETVVGYLIKKKDIIIAIKK